jgi:hypothetical protein
MASATKEVKKAKAPKAPKAPKPVVDISKFPVAAKANPKANYTIEGMDGEFRYCFDKYDLSKDPPASANGKLRVYARQGSKNSAALFEQI